MILDHLTAERIVLTGRAGNKDEVLVELSELLAKAVPGAWMPSILAALREREDSMSTGIGLGVAVPHARMTEVTDVHAALVRYPKGIDFNALDHRPVFLAFGIIGPPPGTGHHVQLLARVARLIKSPEAFDELMSAPDAASVMAVLRHRDK